MRLFLDASPLDARSAAITYASHEARRTPDNVMAYRITAELDPAVKNLPRIGARGTAQLFGEETTLFFFLFRRPISALRQYVGL